MDESTRKSYHSMAKDIFNRDKDTLTGAFATAKGYNEDYKKGLKDGTISDKTTRNQYIYNRWFQEQYLPSEGLTYAGSKTTESSEPEVVTNARRAINYQKSIGNDNAVQEAKDLLKSLGYDPTDYGL
jgi:hypothetical protein